MNPKILQLLDVLMSRNMHFKITSANRTREQNIACNGVWNSQHLTGDAIDIAPIGNTSYKELFSCIESECGLDYDQLIKYRTFIHVSYTRDNIKPRKQLIDK